MPMLIIIICVWLKNIFKKDMMHSQFRGIKRWRTPHLVCSHRQLWRQNKKPQKTTNQPKYLVITTLFLPNKKKFMDDFLLTSIGQVCSQHLLGFFRFWSDKEMKRGMLELCTWYRDRCQQRHAQWEVVTATSLRRRLSAPSLTVSRWKPVVRLPMLR